MENHAFIEIIQNIKEAKIIRRMEVKIHSLHYKCSILNARSATNYVHQTNECGITPKTTSFIIQDKKNMEDTKCKATLYAKNKKCQWYIDSGCSKHMRGYKSKFIKLTKKEKGSVTFGDYVSTKILGKGTITLGKKKNKA